MSIFSTLLLVLYLGISPVGWWPGVSLTAFSTFQSGLFLCAVVAVWAEAMFKHQFSFPKGLLGLVGPIVLMIASASGLSQSDLESSWQCIKDIMLCFAMLWTFFIYSRMSRNVSNVFFAAALIIAAHCFFVVTSKVTGFPNWSGPMEWGSRPLSLNGFTGLRTGWSDGTGLFAPILAVAAFGNWKRAPSAKVVSLLGLLCIIGSQVAVAGKAGMLGSALGLLMMFSFRGMRKYLPFYVATASIAGICLAGYMYEQMRIEQVAQERQSMRKIDRLSAGRIGNNMVAIEMGLQRPIQGYGFDIDTPGRMRITGLGTRGTLGLVHNLWIRLFVQAGIFLPVVFGVISILLYKHSKRAFIRYVYRSDPHERGNGAEAVGYYCRIIIPIGLVISNFEPSFLFGAFQASAAWWAVGGAAVSASTLAMRDGSMPVRW
jgi:hypothetical protein